MRARVKEEVKEQVTCLDAKYTKVFYSVIELWCRYHNGVTVTQKSVLRKGGGSPGLILAATKVALAGPNLAKKTGPGDNFWQPKSDQFGLL